MVNDDLCLQENDLEILKAREAVADDSYHVLLRISVNAICLNKCQAIIFDFRYERLILLKVDGVEDVVFFLTFDGIPDDVVIENLGGWQRNVNLLTVVIHLNRNFLHVITHLYNALAFKIDCIGGARNCDVVKKVTGYSTDFVVVYSPE